MPAKMVIPGLALLLPPRANVGTNVPEAEQMNV